MRSSKWFFSILFIASGAIAESSFSSFDVPRDTNAWHALQACAEIVQEGFSFRQEDGTCAGFLFPRSAWPRRTMVVEADISMWQRHSKNGWNFAGVTLYQDDANYWMLSLVEGPGGTRAVDFLENHDGLWQAQNKANAALKRDGNVSFPWKDEVVYRLRLAFTDGCVTAQVSDPANGRVFGKASFLLGNTPSVDYGRPGLIVRASTAECRKFNYGMQMPLQHAGHVQPAVALLDDILPGHDHAANARLAAMLSAHGLAVTCLSSDQLLSNGTLTGDAYQVLVVPQCDTLPAALGPLVRRFAHEGGHLIFLGGPFLDRAMWRFGDRWLDKEGQRAVLQTVKPIHRPFEIGPSLDTKVWRRSCQNGSVSNEFRVVNEGPERTPCLRMDIRDLQGWDVRHSPELTKLFGEGDDFFTFLGKGDSQTSQLAVEIIERDGSRWIATAPLSCEWRRVGLRLEDFRHWKDSSNRKRGHAGDHLNPTQAVRVCFGLSASHTSAVGPGAHTVWLSEVGTARDPLLAAGIQTPDMSESLETVYPRFKVFTLGTAFLKNQSTGVYGRTVCAIPRPMGEGFRRNGPWRFLPLMEAVDPATKAYGVCEWLLLNKRFPLEGNVIAGFGYTDPNVWSSPEVAGRIADVAERITRGAVFEEAGTEQFAYWPGEEIRLGAGVRVFCGKTEELEVAFQIVKGSQVVWSETVKRAFSNGLSDVNFVWKGPKEPGEFLFSARLSGETNDEIRHGFAVLDPVPAPTNAFITVNDGDFWLRGEKWYPVGINFWPLYVSGMDSRDYRAGFLRDAYYAPALIERDLLHLHDMGINMVSIQTPPLREYRNLLDFLRLCGKYDIHANLYMGQASPLAFNDPELKAYLETARLPGHATVFAYDTIWEPGNHVFKDTAARAKWDGEWREWINERYGSIERAEKDWGVKARRDNAGRVISPSDTCFREDGAWRVMMAAYRRFMDNLTSRYWGKAYRRLRELDARHLISFRQGNTLPYDFALSGPVKHIDFICPEGYSIRDTDEDEGAIGFITRYVDFTTGGKPIVWSEFGKSVWDGANMAPNPDAILKQGHYSERFYRVALEAGADGTAPWWWVGGYRVGEMSDFGIVGPDQTERPAALLIRRYGPLLKTPRDKVSPSAWFEFDRDAHAGGYWRAAFNEGARAYRDAVTSGKRLGIRTKGTCSDSSSVPLIAVGNVPCDGTNPPKYLDAEFDFLQILNADGVWQEAEDGVEIVVSAGRPVRARASVGNTQETTWRDCKSEDMNRYVGLAVCEKTDGRELSFLALPRSGHSAVSSGIPYLGDADFGEFTLLKPMSESSFVSPIALSVRMELLVRGSRVPFGEERLFTLREKK